MFRRISILVLLVSSLTTVAHAQKFFPGHYVSTKGDTVRGLLEYVREGQLFISVNFRENAASESQQIFPRDAKSYLIQGSINRNFVSFQDLEILFNDKPFRANTFLEVLVGGEVSLLRYFDAAAGHEHFFLRKQTEILELPDRMITRPGPRGGTIHGRDLSYTGVFNLFMRDCDKIDHTKILYNSKAFATAVTRYNACRGGGSVVNTGPKREMPRLGLTVGYSLSTLRYHNPRLVVMAPTIDANGNKGSREAILDLAAFTEDKMVSSFPIISPTVNWVLRWNRHLLGSAAIQLINRRWTNDAADIRINSVQVPLTLRYSMALEKKVRPFVGLSANITWGYSVIHTLKSNRILLDNYTEQPRSDFSPTQWSIQYGINGSPILAAGTTGVDVMAGKTILQFALRVESGRTILRADELSTKLLNIDLTVGCLF